MRLPVFLLIQDGKTDSSRGVDVGVGENRLENAFGRSNWVVVSKVHCEDVTASFPRALLGSRDFAMPLEHVCGSIVVLDRFGDKAEGVITPPLFAFLFEPVDDELVNLLLLHEYII